MEVVFLGRACCPLWLINQPQSAACGACDEDLMGHGPGCDVTSSPGVQAKPIGTPF